MGWLYLAIVLFALYMIVELLGVTGLVICLLVALAYGVAAMAIKNIWQVKVYFEGVFRALICFAIAFVLLMATWSPYRPPYLFYAAYFALLLFLPYRLKKERKQTEEAMQKPLQMLMAIIEDFAHFLPGHDRYLSVYLDPGNQSQILLRLFASDIETQRFLYNEYDGSSGYDRYDVYVKHGVFFSKGYQPSGYSFYCYNLLDAKNKNEAETTNAEDGVSVVTFWPNEINILPYLAKAVKAKYPEQVEKISWRNASFDLTFN